MAFTLAGRKALGMYLDGDSANNGLSLLQLLTDSWQASGMFIPFSTEVVQTVTGSPITIGTGGTINVPRPLRMLDTSFFRVNSIDYPITWLPQQEFNEISLKAQAGTFPFYGSYDNNLPLGNIQFWPVPTSKELHLRLDAVFPGFVDFDTDYPIEVGYQSAITYTLAEMACMGIREVPVEVARQAAQARKAILLNNAPVPLWKAPNVTRGLSGGGYYPLPGSYP